VGQNVYFGTKLLVSNGVNVVTDRLGSVRGNSIGERFSYYPYGEERTSTVDGRDKFATYFRDGVGQDYADQRYYNASMGRFWNSDPSGMKAANAGIPTSWNTYAYAHGDPINRYDPSGLDPVSPVCPPDDPCPVDDGGNPCDDDPTMMGCPGYGGGGGGGYQPGGGNDPGGGGSPIPCGQGNPNLTSAQQNLGNVTFGSLDSAQQLVFLAITADAAQAGVSLTGYLLSSASSVWIAGSGQPITELNLTLAAAAGFNNLTTSIAGNFSNAGWDPFHPGGFGTGGNWRQDVPVNSMQITALPQGSQIQIDIDPHNPNIFGGSDLVGMFGHIGDVIHNTLTRKDTNYSKVANALKLNLYNCN